MTASPIPPRLVLLPGMDGTGSLFEPLLQALGPDWPVQVLSYPDDQPLDYPQLLERVLQQIPQDQPFVLVGESFSGPLAVSLAARRPANLRGLVLCCSFVCNPRPALAPLKPFLRFLPLQRLPLWPLDALLLGRFSTEPLRRALAKAIAQPAAHVLQARLQAVIAVDVRQALGLSEVPLLYLRARADRLVPPSACALIRQLRKDARWVEIDAPHCLLQAAPAEAALHLQRFVNGLDEHPRTL
nr:hypothetical protein FFPRI1PSEUD_36430 [Pseudomonas sp. FFPRI_1]